MKKILIYAVILVMCLFLAGCTGVKNKSNELSDAVKFKNEYEELNGKTTSSSKIYATLNLEKDNMIKYKNSNEIINIIKNKTGIIYFGFPECPWCRNMVPVLLEVAKKDNTEINYLNIYDFRSTFVIEDGKAKLTKEGEKDYYTILDLLKNELEDYVLKTDSGEKISAGEKRLYAPTVVFVKEGNIVGIHVSTVDSQTDPYIPLTKEQKDELTNIYQEFINKIK